MPHHRHMVRSQCHVLESRGGVTAGHALTLRLAPAPGREADLRLGLRRLSESAPTRPGIAGLHVLRHEDPTLAATAEQRLRGLADAAADWVLIAVGYDRDALAELGAGELGDAALASMGAVAGAGRGVFDLAYSATGSDVSGIAMPAPTDPAA